MAEQSQRPLAVGKEAIDHLLNAAVIVDGELFPQVGEAFACGFSLRRRELGSHFGGSSGVAAGLALPRIIRSFLVTSYPSVDNARATVEAGTEHKQDGQHEKRERA